jgi:hypothetical protein
MSRTGDDVLQDSGHEENSSYGDESVASDELTEWCVCYINTVISTKIHI